MDMCPFDSYNAPFGWKPVIGIIPVVGDVVGALVALMLYRTCCSIEGGLGSAHKMHMLLNIAADFGIGLMPIVGDLADARFKCNTRNLRLLENALDKKYKPDDT